MQSSCQYSFEPVTEPAAVAAQGQKALCRSGPCVWPRASWTWSYLGFQDFSSSPTFQALDAAKAAPISRRRADPPSARLHEHGTRRHRPRQRTPHGAHNQGLATSGPRGASYRIALPTTTTRRAVAPLATEGPDARCGGASVEGAVHPLRHRHRKAALRRTVPHTARRGKRAQMELALVARCATRGCRDPWPGR